MTANFLHHLFSCAAAPRSEKPIIKEALAKTTGITQATPLVPQLTKTAVIHKAKSIGAEGPMGSTNKQLDRQINTLPIQKPELIHRQPFDDYANTPMRIPKEQASETEIMSRHWKGLMSSNQTTSRHGI
jgi:hypothetical protein